MNFENGHIKLPFSFSGTTVAQVEQDSAEEVLQCVEIILRYRRGQRLDLPEFGIRDQVFRMGGVNMEELQRAIELWEPRARVLFERQPGLLEDMVDTVLTKLSEVREVPNG